MSLGLMQNVAAPVCPCGQCRFQKSAMDARMRTATMALQPAVPDSEAKANAFVPVSVLVPSFAAGLGIDDGNLEERTGVGIRGRLAARYNDRHHLKEL